MTALSVRRLDWHDWPSFSSTWERIHDACPDASFFLTSGWVDSWLATFGDDLNPDLLAFTENDEVVGCCLLVCRTQRVRGIPLRRVYLNCAGEDEADSTAIEYNSVLSLPGYEEGVAKALETFLQQSKWDEFLLQGLVDASPLEAVSRSLGSAEVLVRPSHYVDLCRIRADGAEFDSFLSSNTRQQIRRSQRLYEQTGGACTLRVARTSREALDVFAGLAALHQVAWQGRGRPGVFSSPKFTRFHQRLIQTEFERGRMLLAEVHDGGEIIGALYSFLFRGRVYFYQSGFHYSSDGRLKPGLLTHYLAIRHCIEQPALCEYDFLAGDSQYKRSLATASRPLRWIIVRRPTLMTVVFRLLRAGKRRLSWIN